MRCRDALARAFVALDELEEVPALRPWLFRIAHNRALDLMRSRAIRAAEPIEAVYEVADPESPDPLEALMRREAVETAVSRFVELPTVQRSVVILKDVLDQSLEDIAGLLDLTVNAVKAHLARGRARLKAINAEAPAETAPRPAVTRSRPLCRPVQPARLGRLTGDAGRRRPADPVVLPAARRPRRASAMFFSIYAREPPARVGASLAHGPRGDRGLGGFPGGEAQLLYVAGVDGRPDQFHPRLPPCPLRRRRRGAGPGGGLRSQSPINLTWFDRGRVKT